MLAESLKQASKFAVFTGKGWREIQFSTEPKLLRFFEAFLRKALRTSDMKVLRLQICFASLYRKIRVSRTNANVSRFCGMTPSPLAREK